MNCYKAALIEEHSQLVTRIQNLHNYVYSDKSDNDNKIEFANKCIQLAAMKKYEEALRARLENIGIAFEEDSYFERVENITPVKVQFNGSDYDIECKNCCNCQSKECKSE